MRLGTAARVAASLVITVGGVVTACHNDVPRPTLPAPVAPEVTREAPKPQPIDPQHAPRPDASPEPPRAQLTQHVTTTFAAGDDEHKPVEPPTADPPSDAGVTDVLDMPEVPDGDVVMDAGQQPLK